MRGLRGGGKEDVGEGGEGGEWGGGVKVREVRLVCQGRRGWRKGMGAFAGLCGLGRVDGDLVIGMRSGRFEISIVSIIGVRLL